MNIFVLCLVAERTRENNKKHNCETHNLGNMKHSFNLRILGFDSVSTGEASGQEEGEGSTEASDASIAAKERSVR